MSFVGRYRWGAGVLLAALLFAAIQRIGGLVGMYEGVVAGSVATGAVTGPASSSAVGGLVGRSHGAIVRSAEDRPREPH